VVVAVGVDLSRPEIAGGCKFTPRGGPLPPKNV
jgi:hypothetical protein